MGYAWVAYAADRSSVLYDASGRTINSGTIVFMESYQASNGTYNYTCSYYASGWRKVLYSSGNTAATPNWTSQGLFQLPGSSSISAWYMSRLDQYNRYQYGMSHGTGSYYSLREVTFLCAYSNGSWIQKYGLDSTYKVIIGGGQGYTMFEADQNENYGHVRCWGYIRPDGTVVETTGMYVEVRYIYEHPANYAINTY